MKYIQRYWKIVVSVVFAIAVAVFWALPAVSLLSYHEQYQLFLFTTGYFRERLAVPGGLADYIAEFITQWNYIFVVGALLLALLFFVFQRLTWRIAEDEETADVWYPLSFVPAILMLAYMCDANVMPSFLVALVLVQLLMLLWQKVACGANSVVRVAFIVVVLPLSYWLLGHCHARPCGLHLYICFS